MKNNKALFVIITLILLVSLLCCCKNEPEKGTNNIDEMPLGTHQFNTTMYNNFMNPAGGGSFSITSNSIKYTAGSQTGSTNADKINTKTALDAGWSISDELELLDPPYEGAEEFNYTLTFTKEGETTYSLKFNALYPNDVQIQRFVGDTRDGTFQPVVMTWEWLPET